MLVPEQRPPEPPAALPVFFTDADTSVTDGTFQRGTGRMPVMSLEEGEVVCFRTTNGESHAPSITRELVANDAAPGPICARSTVAQRSTSVEE